MTTQRLDNYQILLVEATTHAINWADEKKRMRAIIASARKNQEITHDELKTLRAWVSRRIEEHRF